MKKTKICKYCNKIKTIDNFYKSSVSKDGIDSKCKQCTLEYHQSEKYRTYKKLYRQKNKEKIAERRKRIRMEHPELDRENSRKWALDNPEKKKEANKNYRTKNKERYKIKQYENKMKIRWNKFGFTSDDYNYMFDQQHGRCAICGKHQSEFTNRFHIDHNHKTDRIRGLLCFRCNVGIGFFNDDIDNLKKAIAYLNEDEIHESI